MLACAAAVFSADRDAWSAEVRVHAPDDCADAGAITEQVDGLLGRGLTAVDGVDFEVDIAAASKQAWRVRVDAVSRADGSRRTREIAGRGCAELAEAAAVAIAMSVDASVAETRAARPPAPPVPAVSAPALAPTAPPPAQSSAPPIRPSAGIGLAMDAGALPGLAFGPALQVAARRDHLRLAAEAAFFPSAETQLSNGGGGGDFRLALGGLLGCFTDGAGRLVWAACAGGEIGRVSGEGTGVVRPRLGSALWLAARAELAVELTFAGRFHAIVAAGAAVPAARPRFVIDQMTPIHQSSRVTARSLLGLGVAF